MERVGVLGPQAKVQPQPAVWEAGEVKPPALQLSNALAAAEPHTWLGRPASLRGQVLWAVVFL